ncbi:Txe/YoeB family addiction module toxin [Enterococcus cecorum]|uniref:Txe/YoeB family addiction module toxin n=2 Tax=Enterococcus cecorum TaxID=44008 RepID=UPI00148E4230|nr:Txe/YoeB family addiction module toxin [Enterococcus cecorum]MCJ0571847.1 Txe/YoeB family addiction module toxin [Enterococcus cecorum]MCJ0583510.1 Txe/YoeB family addiction module toxin [Enterococcus cecorum]MCJ0585235.1 Txe/YoeB family addiction module toxin [Enterococcus cecorum]MCJ0590438.1 Txe/YoeB family addiction module toxin [Enterococcus cecorum]
MKILMSKNAWEDFEYWLNHYKAVAKKIRRLIKEIQREPFRGIGKPEPLKNQWSSYWSRRITDEHRLVYNIYNDTLIIVQARYHYD